MTTFQDGPAKGKTLMLKRAAIFMRVVVNPKGEVDALDQLTDKPADDEKVFAYQITGKPGGVHINRSGGRGGFYPVANYKLVEPQPDQAEMRTDKAWSRCVLNIPVPSEIIERKNESTNPWNGCGEFDN